MKGMEMRRIKIITALLITATALAGCVNVNVTVKNDTAKPDITLEPEAHTENRQTVAGPAVKNVVESDFGTYYEMDDGTWMYEGKSYKYRLEITGRMNNAAKDSTFIYLSNLEDIPFDRAVMASGLSSNTADYFSPEEAVFIGWKE